MKELSKIAFTEMDDAQRAAFELQWVAAWAEELMSECGLSADEASASAPFAFESYLNQEGYTFRDEEIFRLRNKKGVS
tara:strand:+ start:87 stop:320 length:234 start_codon:yes stop_codon:yes gene_type:complete